MLDTSVNSQQSSKTGRRSNPKITNKSTADMKLLKMATHLKEIEDENIKKRVLKHYYKNSVIFS